MKYVRLAAALAAAGALSAAAPGAFASSHREAPLITQTPKLDGTDFYMFRSYEPGRDGYVTMVANYQPAQVPGGGPNYFMMDPQAYYDINIDNAGTGLPQITFRFQFTNKFQNFKLKVGGKLVAEPLIAVGPIGRNGDPADNANADVLETYTVTMITPSGATKLINASTGTTVFSKPIDNIGNKTLPNYAAYAQAMVSNVSIPNCGTGRVFAGQRKDPFVIALGETFDLINYAHPIGEAFNNVAHDDLAGLNVTSLVMEVPIACLTSGADPVIGGWTASSKLFPQADGSIKAEQRSRLGSPLINELIIGLPDKDGWNTSLPVNDVRYGKYVTNPTFPAIVESVFASAGVKAPTAFPRQDLVTVFLTGIPGLTAPAHLAAPSEELRLNTSTPTVAAGKQNRLGVIGGDNAGYPNGRRPGDDIVDITLRVAMGRLYTLGLFGKPSDAPSGGLDFTDGAYLDSTFFDAAFPYIKAPLAGSP